MEIFKLFNLKKFGLEIAVSAMFSLLPTFVFADAMGGAIIGPFILGGVMVIIFTISFLTLRIINFIRGKKWNNLPLFLFSVIITIVLILLLSGFFKLIDEGALQYLRCIKNPSPNCALEAALFSREEKFCNLLPDSTTGTTSTAIRIIGFADRYYYRSDGSSLPSKNTCLSIMTTYLDNRDNRDKSN